MFIVMMLFPPLALYLSSIAIGWVVLISQGEKLAYAGGVPDEN